MNTEQAIIMLRSKRDDYMTRARVYAHLMGDDELAGLALDKAWTFHRQAMLLAGFRYVAATTVAQYQDASRMPWSGPAWTELAAPANRR